MNQENENQVLINSYVHQTLDYWKEELRLSQELMGHTNGSGEFFEWHKGRQEFLQDQITLYESFLLGENNDTQEKPATPSVR